MEGSMWGPVEVAAESSKCLQLGSVDIHIRHSDDEWRFAYTHPKGDAQHGQEPEDSDWLRMVSARNESLELQPALPDRPLVIRPESPVSIFPGRFARFYVAVPVWYRFVSVLQNERTTVIDIPARVLSNTWFGDPANGELCYSLDAPLIRTDEPLGENPSIVTCGLVVRNGSEEKLNFERICVHVENLSVFEIQDRLWTNEIRVLFKGSDQISQITIHDRPPDRPGGAVKLSEPREPENKSILRRSFSFIRYFTGF
jgi:hypothetical protein